MRHGTVLVSILALVSLIAGCSSSSDSNGAGESEAGFAPATVATKFGDVTVPKRPQRVVALGWGDAETALALGVQPVAASDWLDFGGEGVGPWAEGKYTKAPEIIGTREPSYEKIAALRPDLILDVKSSGDKRRHDSLTPIAPTIGVPEGGDNYKISRQQQVRMIAKALGKVEEGEKLLADLDAKIAGIKQAHPQWQGKTVSAIARSSSGWGAYVPGVFRLDLLLELGFAENPKIAALAGQAKNFSVSLSEEQLGTADADLVVGYPINVDPKLFGDSPQWNSIPAVADGRSFIVSPDYSKAYSLGSILSTSYALDKLVPELEKTAK